MFRTLLAHSQEALHKQHLVYCVRVMSANRRPKGNPLIIAFKVISLI
jgi:hypothetical protein